MLEISRKIWHSSSLVRYFIGGSLSALIDLFFLWFFTDYLHVYYLVSQVCAFIISFSFSFYFQKYLTFRDFSKHQVKQGMFFLMFQVIGLGINLIILKISVVYFGIHYLLGSIIAKAIIFIWNYVMNYYFNFSYKGGK